MVIGAGEVIERDLILLQMRRRDFYDGVERSVLTEPGEEEFYITSVVDTGFGRVVDGFQPLTEALSH